MFELNGPRTFNKDGLLYDDLLRKEVLKKKVTAATAPITTITCEHFLDGIGCPHYVKIFGTSRLQYYLSLLVGNQVSVCLENDHIGRTALDMPVSIMMTPEDRIHKNKRQTGWQRQRQFLDLSYEMLYYRFCQ